jgi:uncharacterized protein involved in exopolysaccharide biosynthesis
LAAHVANTVAEEFTRYFAEQRIEETGEKEASLIRSLQQAEADIEKSRQSLSQEKEKKKMASVALQIEEKTSAREHFLKEMKLREMETAGLLEGKRTLEAQLTREEPHLLDEVKKVVNENYMDLRKKRSSLKTELAVLKTKYSDTNARVLALHEEIKSIEALMAEEEPEIVGMISRRTNPNFTLLRDRLLVVESTIQDNRERIEMLKKDIAEYDEEIAALGREEKEINDLNYQVTISENFYQLVSRDYGALRLNKLINPQETFVVDPAAPPTHPYYPNKIMFVGIAAVVSLIIGVGIAFFLDFIDTTVRSVEQAEKIVNAPVLATISDLTPA